MKKENKRLEEVKEIFELISELEGWYICSYTGDSICKPSYTDVCIVLNETELVIKESGKEVKCFIKRTVENQKLFSELLDTINADSYSKAIDFLNNNI